METTLTVQSPQIQQEASLSAKKEGFLGYMNSFLTLSWLTGAASKTKTAKAIGEKVKNIKTIKQTANALKKIKQAKSIATWFSRSIKIGGTALAPFTGGTSLLAGLAAGFALDIVVGEALDVGITIANNGKVLEESKDDWIKLGDFIGQKTYNLIYA